MKSKNREAEIQVSIPDFPMNRPRVLIISPASAQANNGNWQTAWRWSRMLRPVFQTRIAPSWSGEPFDVMLALHARRSAESIAQWARAKGASADAPGLAVVLTGTDLYRDIQTDALAQTSLALAQELVVLQECGPAALPSALRHKARVIFPSATPRQTLVKPQRHLRALMVGHLREEKSPQTLFAVARLLSDHADILIDHIGAALDLELGQQAQACAATCPHYRWLGGLSHEATRRHIQRAHLLVNASCIEGGAHVLMEAMCSGTPVVASKIAGNLGMLGSNYAGYFEQGDAQTLADLLMRCRADQTPEHADDATHADNFYHQLQAQCAQRTPWFAPASEHAALIALVHDLMHEQATCNGAGAK
jgi:putative glycosyltransferase (TIGR04348 family)